MNRTRGDGYQWHSTWRIVPQGNPPMPFRTKEFRTREDGEEMAKWLPSTRGHRTCEIVRLLVGLMVQLAMSQTWNGYSEERGRGIPTSLNLLTYLHDVLPAPSIYRSFLWKYVTPRRPSLSFFTTPRYVCAT